MSLLVILVTVILKHIKKADLLYKGLKIFFLPLDTQDEKERIKKYGAFIRTLPGVNRATLAAIIEHLYRWVDSSNRHFKHGT